MKPLISYNNEIQKTDFKVLQDLMNVSVKTNDENAKLIIPAKEEPSNEATVTLDKNTGDLFVKGDWGNGYSIPVTVKGVEDVIFIKGDWQEGRSISLSVNEKENGIIIEKDNNSGLEAAINHDEGKGVIFERDNFNPGIEAALNKDEGKGNIFEKVETENGLWVSLNHDYSSWGNSVGNKSEDEKDPENNNSQKDDKKINPWIIIFGILTVAGIIWYIRKH